MLASLSGGGVAESTSGMNTNRKGTRNEHRSRALLEAADYTVTRAAASLGVWDLIGVGSTDIVLVQVKSRDWPGSVEMEALSSFASTLLAAGRTPAEVAKLCGHKGPAVTMRVYAHWLTAGYAENALDALGAVASW